MRERLRRWWFALTSLPARLRFRAGRASFVECVIARTVSELVPVLDPAGRPLGPKLLARHTLSCRPPRAGRSGWDLYRERLSAPGRHRFTALECPSCGHYWVIQVTAAAAPLSTPDGRPLAPDADFRSDWFRFSPPDFDGPTALDCPRCETAAVPAVTHLHAP